jgi:hypothetical protein
MFSDFLDPRVLAPPIVSIYTGLANLVYPKPVNVNNGFSCPSSIGQQLMVESDSSVESCVESFGSSSCSISLDYSLKLQKLGT